MANPEHVEVVKRGASALAEWQQENPGVVLDLHEADLRDTELGGVLLVPIDPEDADNSFAKLVVIDLSDADLRDANLRGANFLRTNLSRANLSGTDLRRAVLSEANLSEANLSGADLSQAYLFGAILRGANLSDARLLYTGIAGCDLSLVSGLETVRHEGPSSIGTDTLLSTYQGAGNSLDAGAPRFLHQGRRSRLPVECLPNNCRRDPSLLCLYLLW